METFDETGKLSHLFLFLQAQFEGGLTAAAQTVPPHRRRFVREFYYQMLNILQPLPKKTGGNRKKLRNNAKTLDPLHPDPSLTSGAHPKSSTGSTADLLPQPHGQRQQVSPEAGMLIPNDYHQGPFQLGTLLLAVSTLSL